MRGRGAPAHGNPAARQPSTPMTGVMRPAAPPPHPARRIRRWPQRRGPVWPWRRRGPRAAVRPMRDGRDRARQEIARPMRHLLVQAREMADGPGRADRKRRQPVASRRDRRRQHIRHIELPRGRFGFLDAAGPPSGQPFQLEAVGRHAGRKRHQRIAYRFCDGQRHIERIVVAHHRIDEHVEAVIHVLQPPDDADHPMDLIVGREVAGHHRPAGRERPHLLQNAQHGRQVMCGHADRMRRAVARMVGQQDGGQRQNLVPLRLQCRHRCGIAHRAIGNLR